MVDVEELSSVCKRWLGLAISTELKLESPLKIESQSWAPGDSVIFSGLVNNSEKFENSSIGIPGACGTDLKEDVVVWIREFSSISLALES